MAAALSDSDASAPYVLDTLATVVDASRFLADVAEARALDEDVAGAGEADGRTLADLLVEQVRAWQYMVALHDWAGTQVGQYPSLGIIGASAGRVRLAWHADADSGTVPKRVSELDIPHLGASH